MDINGLITRLLEKRATQKYQTNLTTPEVFDFARWANKNDVPVDVGPNSDYDMTGYYKAEQSGAASSEISDIDQRRHFPDTFKTPKHQSFSSDSQYSDENAPHWDGTLLRSSSGDPEAIELPTGLIRMRRGRK